MMTHEFSDNQEVAIAMFVDASTNDLLDRIERVVFKTLQCPEIAFINGSTSVLLIQPMVGEKFLIDGDFLRAYSKLVRI